MGPAGRNLRERREDEIAVLRPRMRQFERRDVVRDSDYAIKINDIEIERSRPIGLALPAAAEAGLNSLQGLQQRDGLHAGGNGCDGIHKSRIGWVRPGRRGIKPRRRRHSRHSPKRTKRAYNEARRRSAGERKT